MVVHTYSKRERLPRTLLSMRVGHLYEATKEERLELLREVCEEQDLEKYLEESYHPVRSLDDIPAALLGSLQQGLSWPGQAMGEELVRAGFSFNGSPGAVYPSQVAFAVRGKIQPFISRRIGQLEERTWKSTWHILNVLLFVFLLFSALAVGPSGDTGLVSLALALWSGSVAAMILTRMSKGTLSREAERAQTYNRLYAALEKPLIEAIDAVLRKAGRHEELEDLVTNQSWAGRGMPGSSSFSTLDPSYAALLASRERGVRPLWRPTPPPVFKRNFQASNAKRAEEICAEWLKKRGEHNVTTTKDGADGGVDIRSNKYVAQVKNYKGSVGVQPIREIYGIAAAEGKTALFFTSGTYTKAALDFADSVKMPLVTYDAALSRFTGANSAGRVLA